MTFPARPHECASFFYSEKILAKPNWVFGDFSKGFIVKNIFDLFSKNLLLKHFEIFFQGLYCYNEQIIITGAWHFAKIPIFFFKNKILNHYTKP